VKDVEFMLVSELIRNSRKSDRELARKANVCQPTVEDYILAPHECGESGRRSIEEWKQ
jgi:hypothetical protein